MPASALLEALRNRAWAKIPPSRSRLAALVHATHAPALSRRSFLGLGVATVSTAPRLLRAASNAADGFTVDGDESDLRFLADGIEQWRIVPARFSGSPRLRIQRQDGRIELRLAGARYPGTTIPAGFHALITRGWSGWRLELTLEAAPTPINVPFVAWLRGEVEATCHASLEGQFCEHPNGGLGVGGFATLTYHPYWLLQMSGPNVVSGHSAGIAVTGDSLAVALASGQLPGVIDATLRTTIVVESPRTPWALGALAGDHDAWLLEDDEGAFSRLTVEAGEQDGRRVAAAVLEGGSEDSLLRFTPFRAQSPDAGASDTLALNEARVASTWHDPQRNFTLVAEGAGTLEWLHAPGFSAGFTGSGSRLEITHDDAATPQAEFLGALAVLSVPFGDDVSADVRLADPGIVRVRWNEAATCSDLPEGTTGSLALQDGCANIVIAAGARKEISLLRCSDLLQLKFLYEGMELHAGLLGSSLHPVPDSEQACRLTVEFPPQAVVEQAYFTPAAVQVDVPVPDASRPPAEGGASAGTKKPSEIKKELDPEAGKQNPAEAFSAPARSRLSGPSRLVFDVPRDRSIRVAIDDLLDWSALEPVLDHRAVPAGAIPDRVEMVDPRLEGTTHIEAPYRLLLSPVKGLGWAHEAAPVTKAGYTELWHTRLAVLRELIDGRHRRTEPDESARTDRVVRALWTDDYVGLMAEHPAHYSRQAEYSAGTGTRFRTPLDARDRHEIVHLSSHFGMREFGSPCDPPVEYVPAPIGAEHFMLTPLGAGMRLLGQWEPPAVCMDISACTSPATDLRVFTVEEWRHRAALGRDDFVRVLYKGYLFPFGHRAALVKVTERKFESGDRGIDAPLRQRMYIAVRRPVMTYPAPGQPFAGREFPFTRIELITIATPDLDEPREVQDWASSIPKDYRPSNQAAFWPSVGGRDFHFAYRATDHDGAQWEFASPLMFVDAELALRAPEAVVDYYPKAPLPRRTADGRGHRVAFAPSERPESTSFETLRLVFGADNPVKDTPAGSGECKAGIRTLLYRLDQPAFYPRLDAAGLRIAAVDQMTGQQREVRVRYHGTYAAAGFATEANAGEVFLAFHENVDMTFGNGAANVDRAGGVVTPNANLVGVSRKIGLVGGARRGSAPALAGAMIRDAFLEEVRRADPPPDGSLPRDPMEDTLQGKFDPMEFFGGALSSAKILGAVKLWDVVRPLAEAAGGSLGMAPQMIREAAYDAGEAIDAALRDVDRALGQIPPFAMRRLAAQVMAVRGDLAAIRALDPERKVEGLPRLAGDAQRLLQEIQAIVRDPLSLAAEEIQQLKQALSTFSALAASLVGPLKVFSTIGRDLNAALRVALAEELKGMSDEVRRQNPVLLRLEQEYASAERRIAEQLRELSSLDMNPEHLVGALEKAASSLLQSMVQQASHLNLLASALAPSASKLVAAFADVLRAYHAFPVDAEQLIAQQFVALRGELAPVLAAREELRQELATQEVTLRASVRQLQNLPALPSAATAHDLLSASAEVLLRAPLQFADSVRALAVDLSGNLGAGPAAAKLMSGLVGTLQRQIAQPLRKAAEASGAIAEVVPIAGMRALEGSALAAAKQLAEATPANYSAVLGEVAAVLRQWDVLRAQVQDALWMTSAAANVQDVVRSARDDWAKQASRHVDTLSKELGRGLDALRTQLPSSLATIFLPRELDDVVRELKAAGDLRNSTSAIAHVITAFSSAARRIAQQAAAPLEAAEQMAMAQLRELRRELEAQFAALLVPTSLTLRYDWRPVIRSFPDKNPLFEVGGSSNGRENLVITTRITTRVRPDPRSPGVSSEFEMHGSLKDFVVNLFPGAAFLSIGFTELTFTSASGSGTKCVAKISKVTLSEQLSFVQQLQQLLNPSEGPFVELFGAGVRAGYRFGVGSFLVGSMRVTDLRIVVSVELPFDGRPMRAMLQVSEPARPFMILYGVYSGGGSLTMVLGAHGVERIEGSLEFGLTANLRIGPATGYGFIRSGIFFSFAGGTALCRGFVHAGGYMDLLGIISASIYMVVSLTYQRLPSGQTQAYGTASYVVSFRIGFVKRSITITASYTFKGSRTAQGILEAGPEREAPRVAAGADRETNYAKYRSHFTW